MSLCVSLLSVATSPFPLLILLICVFSLFSWRVWLMVCQFFFNLFKEPAFSFIHLCYCFFDFFYISALIFMMSFLLLILSFFFFFFLSLLFPVALCVRLSCLFDDFLVSWGSILLLSTSLLELLLLHPIGFESLCFHCHLFLGIFYFFFDFFSNLLVI